MSNAHSSERRILQRSDGVPWELLRRLGEGRLTQEELDAIMPMFLGEPIEPPSWFVARAATLPRQAKMRAQRPRFIVRLLASLSFDSALQSRVAGVRAVASSSRRIIYHVQSLEVDLEVTEGEDGLAVLTGQVGGPAGRGRYEIELFTGTRLVRSVASNEFGYFVVRSLEAATYRVIIRGEEQEVEIPALSL